MAAKRLEIDHRSDVFSLGLIAYECLAGVLPAWPFEWPFEGHRRFEERVAIASEGVPRMWIFARPWVPLPALEADVETFNQRFDERRYWEVSLR